MRLPLRRQYLRIAARAVRHGRVGWVLRQAAKTLSVPLSARLGRPLVGPLLVNFLVTYRCNSDCFMCDWGRAWFHRGRGPGELTTAEAGRIIDEVGALGAAGLNFTGGEPTLRPDLARLAARAKAAGLFVNVSTNAAALGAPLVAALIDSGVDAFNLSLDGARAETHDRLRGRPGGFDEVRRATELILGRRRAGGRPTVTYLCTVGPENHAELPALVALARARGVDAVSFMPLLAIYRGHRPPSAEELAALEESVAWLRRAKRARPDFVDNSDEYLALFPRAWRGEPSPLRCYAPYLHLAIDAYGNLYPCGLQLHEDRRAGSLRAAPLASLWRSPAYAAVRRELADCRACHWNCHSEANLLYQHGGAAP